MLGDVRYTRQRFEQARATFEGVLDLNPTNGPALLGTAASLHALGRASEAIYFYLLYLAQFPDDVRVMLSLAAVFQSTGQDLPAIQMFERATQLAPEDPDVHGQYGRALYELGREEEAGTKLREAARLESRDSEVYRALGLILEGDGQRVAARAEYERAIEVDPSNIAALLDLTSLLTYGREIPAEDAQAAVRHASRAVEIMQQEGRGGEEIATALWDLGWAHYSLGDWEESVRVSREALDLAPGLTPVRFNLGLALLRAGDPDAALVEYRNAAAGTHDLWDLRSNGVDDLLATRAVAPNLPGLVEIEEVLERREAELKEKRRRVPPGRRT